MLMNPPQHRIPSGGRKSWPFCFNPSIETRRSSPVAFGVTDGNQHSFPYGSILVMQTWACLKDPSTNCILDENGRFQKDPAASPTLFVMRKEQGFGEAYAQNRTGEWEYVAYRVDGTYHLNYAHD